jgi:peroxiredoxin
MEARNTTHNAVPKPRTQAPRLDVETVGGGRWSLAGQSPALFTLVVFYRGLHCPVCRNYLRDLDRRVEDFASRGVGVIAVSGDTRERAEATRDEWELSRVTIGYGQSLDSMREWGLFVSTRTKDPEPDAFAEPGLFLVDAAGAIYYEALNSMAFGRPSFRDLLHGVDAIREHGYPPRGDA